VRATGRHHAKSALKYLSAHSGYFRADHKVLEYMA
jgi:hypothetical protein